MSDAELLAATTAGDAEAFGLIYQRHRDVLWAAAARITGPQDADDALQDGMIKAFRQAHQFKGNSAVSTWLHRIVINAAHDLVRRRKLVAEPAVEPSYLPWSISQADQRMAIAKYWPRLTRDQQLAIALLDLLDLPVAEAAQVLGVSEGTVKVRAARGRHILARYIPRQVAALQNYQAASSRRASSSRRGPQGSRRRSLCREPSTTAQQIPGDPFPPGDTSPWPGICVACTLD